MANRVLGLLDTAARLPDQIALTSPDREFCFAALIDAVRVMAGWLAACGVGQGGHVGVLLPQGAEFILVQQALFWLGAVFVPINPLFRATEIGHAATACQLAFLVSDATLAPALVALPPACRLLRLSAAASTPCAPPDPAPVAPDDTVMLLLTSATTGRAKPVRLTAANLAANYDRTPGWLGLDRHSVILGALPLCNSFGLNQCINVMTSTGAHLVLLARFDAGACLAALARHRCSFFPAVPTMLKKLLDHPACDASALASLRAVLTGAAPVPAPLLQQLASGAPALRLMTGYGLTEATALVTLRQVALAPDGTLASPRGIGRPLDGFTLAILDEAGQPLPDGEPGEIALRGPSVSPGYLAAPEATALAFRNGWLHTGDLGIRAPDGTIILVDRKKDLIIRGGQNLYPTEIEDVLYAVPGVAEAAVIGREDPVLGEVAVAFLAASPGMVIEPAIVLAHCQLHLAPFKIPVAIHVLAELPKGPTGKILRRALREIPA